MKTLGIYIHIPFCAKKCPYCDFFSTSYNKNSVNLYIDAVIRNIKAYSRKLTVDTVYFGGGTPSLLPPVYIAKILQSLRENFILDKNAEITLETNPNTVNFQKLIDFYEIGINRLSIGVQSLVPSELKILGRTHSVEKSIETVLNANKIGFKNISCDMIIGLPQQNIQNISFTIQKLSELPINHISSYILKIEENTPFNSPDFISTMPDEDEVADFYLYMVNALEKNGFFQYEVSNFAKDGFQSRHNNKYWKCHDYLGIGSSAHSCFEGKRFAVSPNFENFINAPVQNICVTENNPCQFQEYAMLKLRLKEGLNLSEFGENKNQIIRKIPSLLNAEYINFNNNIISLTPKGFLMSNSIIEYLIF